MNFFISYFNNIRNMDYHCIPVSTAKWDPKWYHKDFCFIDKRGVSNGLRCEQLVLDDAEWLHLVKLNEDCVSCKHTKDISKHWCQFMITYYRCLQKQDFNEIMSVLYMYARTIAALWNEPVEKFNIVLMVHEKPDVQCCERPVLIKYFNDNFIELKEWTKEETSCD